MAIYTYEVDTTKNFPNITVYKYLKDGVQIGYRVNPNEGYVMYDTTSNDSIYDPETEQDIPITYYYTVMYTPLNYDFNNFTWVAVPRDSVPENQIMGDTDNDHEVMSDGEQTETE